jgi:Zn-dependent protease
MSGTIRLGTILGIPVSMNWSVLLIAGLIAFSVSGQLLPAQVPGLTDAAYWGAGILVATLFFGSLLAHELSHAIVARREGLVVRGITLWLLGGVARMEGDARSPGSEARIAGVGPLTSLGLALSFLLAAMAIGLLPTSDLAALAGTAAAWLALVNFILAAFNMLPGVPLDGGRVARAIFWRWRRDKLQATRWATGLGQLLGYGLIGIGLFRAINGDLGGLWFMLLGFFLTTAAGAERSSTELVETLRGVRVGEIMTRDPMRVPGSLTVDVFVEYAVRESRASTWLVTGPGGDVTGVLTLDQLRGVRGDARKTTRLGDLATALEQSPTAYADEEVVDVLQRLGGSAARAVVRERVGWQGEVIGLLTPEDVDRSVQLGRLQGGQGGQASKADSEQSQGRVLP